VQRAKCSRRQNGKEEWHCRQQAADLRVLEEEITRHCTASRVSRDWRSKYRSRSSDCTGSNLGKCSAEKIVDGSNARLFIIIMWPQLENAAAVVVESATTEQRPESCDDDGGLEEEEFEFFSMSSSSATASSEDQRIVCPSVVMSSADELFFKGQLLPLHLTPRLRMVQNLASYQKQQQQLKSEKTSQIAPPPPPPSVLQTLPCPSFHHPKYSRFWMHSNAELLSSSSPDASTTSAAPDYCGIGSRFRGQWSDHPRERDSSCSSTDVCSRDSTSARDSSSSRDSNGSSQDANFSDSSTSKDHFPISSSFLQQQRNREVFRTHGFRSPTEEGSSSSSVVVSSSSTFKLPSFKWKKVLFGTKKVAAVAKSTSASSSLLDPKAGQQRMLHHRLADVSEEESGASASASVDTSGAICVGEDDVLVCDEYFSDYSGELSSLQSGGGYTESQQAAIVVGADGERDQGGMTKAREYLQKYMRILKPLHHVKKNDELLNYDHLDEQPRRGVSLPASSSSLLHESGRQSRNVPGNRSFSSFSQTARLASIDFNPRSHSSLGTAAARRGSGRPAVCSSTSTSSGFTSELHSAIQGAIAHCKESQSSAKNQHASGSQRSASSSVALS
jgi:hypothetical protein